MKPKSYSLKLHKTVVTIIAVMMTVGILTGKLSSSSGLTGPFLHTSVTAVTNTKWSCQWLSGEKEEKNPYGHYPLTIIFFSAWGTIKTDIKLLELPSFIILLLITGKDTMKVSLC